MTAQALLTEKPDPSEEDIHQWISGNLRRCTGYKNIVTAIREAAKALAAEQPSDLCGVNTADGIHWRES